MEVLPVKIQTKSETSRINLGWQKIPVKVVRGYQVCSGTNGDPRFPGGTLRMQIPYFQALGLDISNYHPGTLNISIDPMRYRRMKPRVTFRGVKWHPTEPAEDFSFIDIRLLRPGLPVVEGLIYHPHPETQPEHHQKPDVLELLFPYLEGVPYGSALTVEIPAEQMLIVKA